MAGEGGGRERFEGATMRGGNCAGFIDLNSLTHCPVQPSAVGKVETCHAGGSSALEGPEGHASIVVSRLRWACLAGEVIALPEGAVIPRSLDFVKKIPE